MSDINSYTNDRLIEFLDAFHLELSATIEGKFGEDWLALGIAKHLNEGYFDRTKAMLTSPMRVVDMGKTDEEIFGVEHLWNIVNGNWALFSERLGNRNRTETYLAEIAELRHNVSHRRQRHYLRRSELARFLQNARMLLTALGSPDAERFGTIAESIAAGGSPWGSPLAASLPPHDEIFDEFVGRPRELRDLATWLASDSPQHVLWGYGGAGKSAIAYQFARDVRDAAPVSLHAIVWVSAKRKEFIEGIEREKQSDFSDLASFVAAVWKGLYGSGVAGDHGEPAGLVNELSSTPTLLVVDDFDSILNDDELTQFILFDLRASKSKVLYTSRHRVTGVKATEVLGFEGEELTRFIRTRAKEHGLDQDTAAARVDSIGSVTGGFPLFVDDLLRYARLVGLTAAIADWTQRRGDAARLYALRRQLEHLGDLARDTLIAISVANRALTGVEISQLSGRTDEDVLDAIEDLKAWKLIIEVAAAQEARPGFDMNANTRRLVAKTYKGDPRIAGYQSAFKSLSGTPMSVAKRQAIGSVINIARALVLRGETEEAIADLKASMTGELELAPDVWGVLGWVYSRDHDRNAELARAAFDRAHRLGSVKEDTYFHWSAMERDIAERDVRLIEDFAAVQTWQRCSSIAQLGIDRIGDTQTLCNMAGYAKSREAKSYERLNQFIDAQRCFGESVAYFRNGLTARASESRDIPRGVLFRGLVIAYEGLNDIPGLAQAFRDWDGFAPDDYYCITERERLVQKFPALVTSL